LPPISFVPEDPTVSDSGRNQRPARAAARPQRGGRGGATKRTEKRTDTRPDRRTDKRADKRTDKRTERPTEKPRTRGAKSSGERGSSSSKDGRSSGRKNDWKRPAEKQAPRTARQAQYDGPELPPDITGAELDRSISAQLKGLPEKLAARVTKHLVAAGMLIDDDPETAYQHALAARSRAPRLAVVREAAGEAAYASGHYAEALADLRAAKRMNGVTAYLPIMADCHRALGQPEQAVKLARSPSVASFAPAAKAEMTIVEAGARRDMGQVDAALRVLEQAPLMSKSRDPWVVRLRYAYADTLEAAGRVAEALTWFHRAYAIDRDEITDAAARAEELEKRLDQ
jgi:tetratricopeptide (TPR) repeat protein